MSFPIVNSGGLAGTALRPMVGASIDFLVAHGRRADGLYIHRFDTLGACWTGAGISTIRPSCCLLSRTPGARSGAPTCSASRRRSTTRSTRMATAPRWISRGRDRGLPALPPEPAYALAGRLHGALRGDREGALAARRRAHRSSLRAIAVTGMVSTLPVATLRETTSSPTSIFSTGTSPWFVWTGVPAAKHCGQEEPFPELGFPSGVPSASPAHSSQTAARPIRSPTRAKQITCFNGTESVESPYGIQHAVDALCNRG